jgi:hypothetical protein
VKRGRVTQPEPEARVAAKTLQVDDQVLEWPLEPETGTAGASRVHHWTSTCGRYRVTRVDPTLDREGAVYFAAQYKIYGGGWPKGGGWEAAALSEDGRNGNYLKRFRGLRSAMEAAEAFHRKISETPKLSSNREEVVSAAERLKLAGGRDTGEVPLAEVVSVVRKRQKPETDNLPRDEFGSLAGSNFAKANAVLTKSPKKMKQIVAEASLEDTVYNHLNKLAKDGVIGKSAEGYFLLK